MSTSPFRFAHILMIAALFLLPGAPVLAASPLGVSQPAALKAAPVFDPGRSASALFNTNLIPDGDAEIPYTAYWHDNEGFHPDRPLWSRVGRCIFPAPTTRPAPARAEFLLSGHNHQPFNGNNLWLNNKISLGSIQAAIDSGKVRYILSGYFGGRPPRPARPSSKCFLKAAGFDREVVVGGIARRAAESNRADLPRKNGHLPAGTQYINLALQSGALSGSDYRTGYADNLSLILLPVQIFLPQMIQGQTGPPPQTGLPAPTRRVCHPERPDPHGHLLDR